MQAISGYNYLGLLAVCLLVCGLAFVIIRWPQGKQATFSQHVAMQKQSIMYYSVLFCIVLPILLLFFVGWFTPTFKLPMWFNLCIAASSMTQIVCTFIPEVGGWKTTYHRAFAGASAVCLVPAILCLAFSNQINSLSRVLAVFGAMTMLGIITILIRGGGKHSHLLTLQSTYFAVFFIPVLTASYL